MADHHFAKRCFNSIIHLLAFFFFLFAFQVVIDETGLHYYYQVGAQNWLEPCLTWLLNLQFYILVLCVYSTELVIYNGTLHQKTTGARGCSNSNILFVFSNLI